MKIAGLMWRIMRITRMNKTNTIERFESQREKNIPAVIEEIMI